MPVQFNLNPILNAYSNRLQRGRNADFLAQVGKLDPTSSNFEQNSLLLGNRYRMSNPLDIAKTIGKGKERGYRKSLLSNLDISGLTPNEQALFQVGARSGNLNSLSYLIGKRQQEKFMNMRKALSKEITNVVGDGTATQEDLNKVIASKAGQELFSYTGSYPVPMQINKDNKLLDYLISRDEAARKQKAIDDAKKKNILKGFFRNLPRPLRPKDVITKSYETVPKTWWDHTKDFGTYSALNIFGGPTNPATMQAFYEMGQPKHKTVTDLSKGGKQIFEQQKQSLYNLLREHPEYFPVANSATAYFDRNLLNLGLIDNKNAISKNVQTLLNRGQNISENVPVTTSDDLSQMLVNGLEIK